MKKIFVLDTSVVLTSANSLYEFKTADIILPLKVLEEVDKHKNRQDSVGQNARNFIKILDALRENGSLHDGVRIQKGRGIVKVCAFEPSTFPADLDLEIPDHVIIATAFAIAKKHQDSKVTVVSRDVNMRVICDSLGLGSQSYDASQVISDSSELYSGVEEIVVDDEFIERLYRGEAMHLDDKRADKLYPNQFLTLISNNNANKTALARFINKDVPLRRLPEYKGKNKSVFGVESRNREQSFAMDLLMDPNVPIVTLVGKAGSGKTLTAIAAGLEQLLHKGGYTRLIVSRPVQPLGRDIGFLPGPQPLDAKILTPDGWTTMGEIKVGSEVIGRDGKPTKVLGVFPKGKKTVYRVTTTDGTSTECCEDHLWQTTTFLERKSKKKGKVRFTRDIIETLKTSKGKINHHIPRNEAVHYNKKELPISPYVLGVLLGDGCIKDNISFASMDQHIVNKVTNKIKQNNCYLSNNSRNINYYITNKPYNNKPARPVTVTNLLNNNSQTFDSVGIASHSLNINKNTLQSRCDKKLVINNFQYNFEKRISKWQNPIKNELEKLGLSNKKAWEKFIPDIYKYSSVDDRIELLKGLMDTDGTVKKNGEVSYTTTSTQLAHDMQELVRSLGGRATIVERPIRNKGANILGREIISKRKTYEFTVSLPENINPFFLPRKASRFSSKYIHGVGIADIQEVGEKEVQCIFVENSEHLYITDNFIVTHNTLEEKMLPWLTPIQDNLQFLLGNDKATLQEYMLKGQIEIEALTYIRGRSIAKAFMIVDEAQNLTSHELKTIVTRVGEGTKIVLTGDIEQIDNIYVNDTSNGLAYAVEKFKAAQLAGHISLQKGERSSVASLAARVL